jgi:glyoxylase-like metal-dependent hydrolase (beta-lactamase superfamily II)
MAHPAPVDHGHGIHAVDSGYVRANLDAIHLIVERGRAAVVDTGTSGAVPRVLAALDRLGVTREAVDWILVTHVHLDHAGGAGALLRHLPSARVVVHPRGARHLEDPAKLVAGTRAVYGDAEFDRLYGQVVPVPAERLLIAEDGLRLALAGRELRFFDTPGHARHHYCIHDPASRSVFAGDTFGISYREFDAGGREFIFPTSTPTQFDPVAAHESVRRIAALEPAQVFVTHFSRVGHVPRHAATLHRLLDEYVALARAARDAPDPLAALHAAMRSLLLAEARRHGTALDDGQVLALLAMDIDLNAQGLAIWLAAQAG